MGTYTFYIDDERYSVPTLLFVDAANESAVRRLAREKLGEPHHLSVEVRDSERLLFQLVRPTGDQDDGESLGFPACSSD